MYTYEVMFLFDPAFGADQENVEKEVNRLVERAKGELIVMHRWTERKLAYEIKKRKRGVYIIAYAKFDGANIPGLERDVQLSEDVLRVMVLRADHVSEEKMKNPPPPPSESMRRSGDEWESRGRGPGRGGPRRFDGPPGRRDRFDGRHRDEAKDADSDLDDGSSADADADPVESAS